MPIDFTRTRGLSAAGWRMRPALLLLTCWSATAQPQPMANGPVDFGRFHGVYLGNVGNSRVLAVLTVNGGHIQGTYVYDRVGQPLSLEGRLTPLCVLTLVESDSSAPHTAGNPNAPTGHFQGTCTPDTLQFKGTWSSPDQKRHLSFSLKPIARLHSESVRGKGISSSASLEVSYPEFPPTTGQLGHFVNEQITADVRKRVEAFHQDADAPEEDFKLEVTVGYQIVLFSDTLISIRVVTTQEQAGGRSQRVHTSRLFTLDKSGPREASAKDLLVAPVSKSAARLAALGEQALPKTESSSEQPRILPVLRGEELALTVTPRGLELYYVLPPVDGAPLPLLLPYTSVKEVLSRTGVLRSRMN